MKPCFIIAETSLDFSEFSAAIEAESRFAVLKLEENELRMAKTKIFSGKLECNGGRSTNETKFG